MQHSVPEQPPWDEGVHFPQFSPLPESTAADVVVIGGGLTGVTTAYLLSKAGHDVVLLEKNRLGHGATGVTTAFLTQSLDTDIQSLVSMFGAEKTKAMIAAHASAIDLVEQIVREEKIACEFMRCSNYFYASAASDRADLEKEQQAAEKIGVPLLLKEEGLSFAHHGYLELAQQAKFHPLQYLAGLAEVLKKRGVRIFEGTEAAKVEAEAEAAVVTIDDSRTIRAQSVVVATYAPFDKKLFFKKSFYTSYVLHAALAKDAVPAAIYEDTDNPYHYWRIDRGETQDRLIFGGADHRSDVPADPAKNWRALEEELGELFADIPYTIDSRWEGPILETVDGLAYIGPVDSDRLLYATGFSGNGMTYAHIAAQLFFDHIQKKKNPHQAIFDARRKPSLISLLHKGRDYSEEMLRGVVRNSLRY
jgi:glycine/D-amino acid oxidase-like deaminating enzyme